MMVGILSDVGNRRKINEDYVGFFENEEIRIYVIADGMGGHNAGEVASKIAVDVIIDYVKKAEDSSDLKYLLQNAVYGANDQIHKYSNNNEELSGMGTTVTACLIKNNRLIVANVGDSRCYIIKNNELIKVTKDHSLVQQLLDNGSITEEEAVKHPNKNIITRALGTSSDVEVDIFELDISDIIKVILCTDGLTNEVTGEELYNIVSEYNSQEACNKLIETCKSREARDNISVIVIEGECNDDRYFTRK